MLAVSQREISILRDIFLHNKKKILFIKIQHSKIKFYFTNATKIPLEGNFKLVNIMMNISISECVVANSISKFISSCFLTQIK